MGEQNYVTGYAGIFRIRRIKAGFSKNYVRALKINYLLLIFEVDGRIKVRNIRLRHLQDQVLLASMRHFTNADYSLRWAKVLK